ncbi:MAG: hypothetical protein JXR86_00505 [Spirochaetales bacterium]|nr:hypothetical protein [Spirochaetales bacterium]
MSKTYRKASISDNNRGGARWSKRQANKAVRRLEGEIPKGYGFIKKIYNSWDIHDYKFVSYTKRDVIVSLEFQLSFSDTGVVNLYRRDPDVYKTKLFSRDSIRFMEE